MVVLNCKGGRARLPLKPIRKNIKKFYNLFKKYVFNTNVEKVEGLDGYLPKLEPQFVCNQVGRLANPPYSFKTATRVFHDIPFAMMVIPEREKYRNAVICLSIYDTVIMF